MENFSISGATQLLGIVGDPVVQVRAPEVWTRLFRYNSINAVCVPLHVKPNDLARFIEVAKTVHNMTGLIITVPHKIAVLNSVTHPTARASLVGAANIVRWDSSGDTHADHIDGLGFVRGLAVQGHDVNGKSVLIAGCGGVGTAIAFALAEAGAAKLTLFDPRQECSLDLKRRLTNAGHDAEVGLARAAGFDIVVNASPIGMNLDDPLPIDCGGLQPSTLVADVIMHPPVTRLLKTAADMGCAIQPGVHMMDQQLPLIAQFLGFEGGDWSPKAVARSGS